MATTYKTPGVYVEEIPKLPPSIAQVETAIPAFIGYTQSALDNQGNSLTLKPTRISSLLEYESMFGTAQPEENMRLTYDETQDGSGNTTAETIKADFSGASSRHNMYYSLKGYFANGGGPCYIVSVGPYKAVGDPLVRSELEAGLAEVEKEDEPTLIVYPEGQNLGEGDYYSIQVSTLAQCNKLQDRFSIMDVYSTGASVTNSAQLNTALSAFRTGIASPNLKYGAAYFPNVNTVYSFTADETKVDIVHNINGAPTGTLNGLTLDGIKASNTESYTKLKAGLGKLPVVLPPSPVLAGVYAQVDNSRGVWKAPANVPLADVISPACKITHEMQSGMNVDPSTGKSVNAIRAFTGKGTLVWGARTLLGNDNEWRYVNVRRFFNMVEESSKKATEPFVFEPNDANTWVKVQAMIENFLTNLWRQGALQGAKPEHAFYVAVGLGKTMTAFDILEGRMIVEIGMAVVRPAEFIILRFSHKMAES